MSLMKSQTEARYRKNVEEGSEPLITPEVSRILRGMLRVTLKRAADGASIKKNQLQKYESGDCGLSVRDRRWLQSAFEGAGAEFIKGQGELFVTLNGQPLIGMGKIVDDLKGLPLGAACAEMRYERGLSQRDAYKRSGVRVFRISAIENNRPQEYFLADRVALKKLFDETPVDKEAAYRLQLRQWGLVI
ncbi:MAG: hypothetical protein DI551_11540 [Micavibrio aeruginosavorus]|uniref:Uncharacterized protein n=1 Tax=Micavibrio aeruginosavorus TaxID=349221 RepID=A0A2W5MYK7_9BACT|nr:MAG: hypothetical protein DI551_11540 [Micavibrio aeruginosavorus]